MPLPPGLGPIRQIEAGFEHLLVLTGASRSQSLEMLLPTLTHRLARADDGQVWGTGCNTDGQLGLGSASSDVFELTRVPLPREVEQQGGVERISAGADTSALVTKSGTLWVWGNSVRRSPFLSCARPSLGCRSSTFSLAAGIRPGHARREDRPDNVAACHQARLPAVEPPARRLPMRRLVRARSRRCVSLLLFSLPPDGRWKTQRNDERCRGHQIRSARRARPSPPRERPVAAHESEQARPTNTGTPSDGGLGRPVSHVSWRALACGSLCGLAGLEGRKASLAAVVGQERGAGRPLIAASSLTTSSSTCTSRRARRRSADPFMRHRRPRAQTLARSTRRASARSGSARACCTARHRSGSSIWKERA